jgi:hypothetical protein
LEHHSRDSTDSVTITHNCIPLDAHQLRNGEGNRTNHIPLPSPKTVPSPDLPVGHFQRAVPENPLKVESVSSALQVANREGVTKRMCGEWYPCDVQLLLQPIKLMQDVSRMAAATVPGREDEHVLVLVQELEEHLPKPHRHRQNTFPSAFSSDAKEEIIKVEMISLER